MSCKNIRNCCPLVSRVRQQLQTRNTPLPNDRRAFFLGDQIPLKKIAWLVRSGLSLWSLCVTGT